VNIRTELSDREEIVLRYREDTVEMQALVADIENLLRRGSVIGLLAGATECFLSKQEILFFESSGGKVYAHTDGAIYQAPYRLFELEGLLPPSFQRVSKSAIANLSRVVTLRRELVGNGVLGFRDSEKTVYFSRSYYKLLQEKLKEMRS